MSENWPIVQISTIILVDKIDEVFSIVIMAFVLNRIEHQYSTESSLFIDPTLSLFDKGKVDTESRAHTLIVV